MMVEEERKHLKSKLSTDNITRGGGWFASRYARQEASTSALGGIVVRPFSTFHLKWAAIWFPGQHQKILTARIHVSAEQRLDRA